jgi:hypothetical protein
MPGVPKFWYFIVVHAYECQNFAAVPMFTYRGRGLWNKTDNGKLGYIPLVDPTGPRMIADNEVAHGALEVERIHRTGATDPILPLSVVFFTYPVLFLYKKNINLAGNKTEQSRRKLLDLFYGYIDTKQMGIPQVPRTILTDEGCAQRDNTIARLTTGNRDIQTSLDDES